MSEAGFRQWQNVQAAVPNNGVRQAAKARQATLTKPPGALGCLEEIAVRLAALQASEQPEVERIRISVFAGDHGVAAEGVSAFPQAVTAEMVRNFAAGGAAICVAARAIGADLEVVNLGTVNDTGTLSGVKNRSLGAGTANFTAEPAMTAHQLSGALAAGREAVELARRAGAQLFIGGEMGIGNTTATSALACALLNASPHQLTGPGAGLESEGLAHKTRVIQRALERHNPYLRSPLEAMRRIAGFELAALTGAYLSCAREGLPVLVDGFISSVAALAAVRLCPRASAWFVFSHASAEPGHRRVLDALDARPVLDLSMRLGEGSGAAIAVPLLRLACELHNKMATFTHAQVSGKL